jgi:hypothetical protein
MSAGDQLLYAISARGAMSWVSVRHAFDCLHEGQSDVHDEEAWRYRRRDAVTVLENLAHVEFDTRRQRMIVVATPPAIAVLPGLGLPRGVLVGARSPSGIERLALAAKHTGIGWSVRSQHRDKNFSPACISLVAETIGDRMVFARAERLDCAEIPAAWSILYSAGSMDEYLGTLATEDLNSLNWEREDFDPTALFFRKSPRNDTVMLSRYTHPARRTRLCVLRQAGVTARVDPDWGRYAVMRALARNVLAYDAEAFALAIPITMPLPKLLARSLCLCSGLLPLEVAGIHWPGSTVKARVYRRVPLSMAELIAKKLQQQLVPRGLCNADLRKTQYG